MKPTIRLRFATTILLAMAAVGCDTATSTSTPFDGQTPVIVGTIISRQPIDGMAGMMVIEDGAPSDDCYPHRATFTLGPGVMVFENGHSKGTSDLKVGRRVSVFAPTPTIKPCLPAAPAQGVLLY